MADELNRPEIKNFIEAFVEEDIGPGGQYEGMQVHTRFPPEPNGYLHIGHCKALCIDFGTAEKFGGICNLRMDDTNPTKEDTEYVEAIKEDIRWLGFTWDDRFYYASQYFDKMYECAEDLIRKGLAYVCELTPEQMREYRGDLTTPARSPYRDRPIEESLDLFNLGLLDLNTRAQIEQLFWSIAREVGDFANAMKHAPEELRKVSKMVPDKYFCNFSLFQSLPDSWAIDQIFPIIPISRLDEKPTRTCTIQDITCDSDGKISNYISIHGGTASSLPVHSVKSGEPYYIGVFLVGAYQEILGDMHNLFGDTNAVHISVNKDSYEIERVIDGETVADVLDYVQYNPKKLVRNVEAWVTSSMKAGKISPEEGREFLSMYRSGLYGYTYIEKE